MRNKQASILKRIYAYKCGLFRHMKPFFVRKYAAIYVNFFTKSTLGFCLTYDQLQNSASSVVRGVSKLRKIHNFSKNNI